MVWREGTGRSEVGEEGHDEENYGAASSSMTGPGSRFGIHVFGACLAHELHALVANPQKPDASRPDSTTNGVEAEHSANSRASMHGSTSYVFERPEEHQDAMARSISDILVISIVGSLKEALERTHRML